MQLFSIKLNLREKLYLIISLGLLIFFAIFGGFRLYQAKSEVMAEINRSGFERASLISESVANLIVAYDYSNLESLAERIIQMEDIKQITVMNRHGKIMATRNSSDFNPDQQNLAFQAPVLFSGAPIGKVQILLSMERIEAATLLVYRNILIVFSLFAFIFGILIYATVSVFIVKPLIRLSDAADQLALGNFSANLPPDSGDELGHMVRAFSAMRESRKQVENELNDLNASLETIVMSRVAELRDSEAYVHAVLANINEGIIVISEEGIIISFNTAAEKIFGYSNSEIIHQRFGQLLSEENVETSGKYFKYPGMQNDTQEFGIIREVVGLRKNYSAFPLELKTRQLEIQGKLLFITSARDISDRKEAEQRIRYMASHDSLTNLPNRSLLQDRIQQTLLHNERRELQAAVIFIDLDNFKVINDTLGHDIGDGLLEETASRLVAEIRSEDTVARQGGDEFIILLSNISQPEDAGNIAKKLLHSIAQSYNIKGKELHISASIGIAIYPDDGATMELLLKNSDIAMYHAKETGRGNFQFFSESMNAQAAEKHALSTDLHHAVDRGELFLVYQPVVEIIGGKIVGLEVLLRWQHPVHGLISPDKFIPLAEESGIILAVGEWVLRTACKQLLTWQQQGYAVPRLAINLSAKQFRQKLLTETVAQILKENNIEPYLIGFEITESMLVHNIEEVVETLLKLSNMGLEISIDDFGTGYSSLSYLKRFPIDKIKIDKSFIDDIATREDDAAIVRAIIAMAHGLRMKVVTEGVETQAQLDFLRSNGCEQYQGYLFSKPLTALLIESKLTPQT